MHQEDSKLIAYVTRYGCWNWCQLPKFAGLARCGKSCRLRWMNYLRPNIKRGNYTQEEEDIIISLHQKLGNSWSAIAAQLSGRIDNDIKNHWHSTLKKQMQQNSVRLRNEKAVVSKSKCHRPATSQIPDTGLLSQQSSSSEFSGITIESTAASDQNLVLENGFAFLDSHTQPMSGNLWTEPYMAESDTSNVPSEIIPNNDASQTQTTNLILEVSALSPQP